MIESFLRKKISHPEGLMEGNRLERLSLKLHFYVMLLLLAQSIPVTIYRYLHFPIIFTWINLVEIVIYSTSLVFFLKQKHNFSIWFAAFSLPIITIYVIFFMDIVPINEGFVATFWFALCYMFVYILLIRSAKVRIAYISFCLLLFFVPGAIFTYDPAETVIKIIQIVTLTLFPFIISKFIEQQDNKIYDLTRSLQNRLNEKERLAEELEKKNDELVMFSHMMSHDLKSPLRNIKSFATLLKKKLNLEQTNEIEYFGFIENSAEQMNTLIGDLLTYSKIEVEEKQFEPIDLVQIFENIKYQFQFDINQGKVQFDISPLPSINGNEDLLKTLFQNIISNGVKYQPKDKTNHIPTISITATEDKKHHHIFIADNGIGMSEKNVKQLFQPFKRFHNQNEYEGTGLGMSICKKVMDKHSGQITVENSDEFGTTLKLSFKKKSIEELEKKIPAFVLHDN